MNISRLKRFIQKRTTTGVVNKTPVPTPSIHTISIAKIKPYLFYTVCQGSDRYWNMLNMCLDSLRTCTDLNQVEVVLLTNKKIELSDVKVIDTNDNKDLNNFYSKFPSSVVMWSKELAPVLKPALFNRCFIDYFYNIADYSRIFYFDIDILFHKNMIELLNILGNEKIFVNSSSEKETGLDPDYKSIIEYVNAGFIILDPRKFPLFYDHWREEIESSWNECLFDQAALRKSFIKNYKHDYEVINPIKYGGKRGCHCSNPYFIHYVNRRQKKMINDYETKFSRR